MEMKSSLAIILGVFSFGLFGAATAQTKDEAVAIDATEAIVTVVEVDEYKRTVTVRGPRGNMAVITVPPESQNLDQVHPGARFKVRYVESVAVSITKGGAASSSSGRSMKLAPKGDIPGGMIVNVRQIAGIVESIDHSGRILSIRGPEGNVLAVKVDDEVQGLDKLEKGDRISVEYTESLAMRMIKQ
jgi:hypothetical protein